MTKTFYVQTNSENIITDVIEYPTDGYIPVELPIPLPIGVNGGWWKLENGQPVEYPELKPETELEQRISDIEIAIASILGGAE